MLRNYLKVALRNLFKNKVFLIVNVLGLGLSLASCIVAYLNTRYDWGFDEHHENIDNIYNVHYMHENKGEMVEHGNSPLPLGPAMMKDITGLKGVYRYGIDYFTVKDNRFTDKIFSTNVCFADPGFFDAYTFREIEGDPNAFHQIENAVITDKYAAKFFGDENPLGKVLTVFDDNGKSINYTVGGVVEAPPKNSSIQFEVLLNLENRYRLYENFKKADWGSFIHATFVHLESPGDAERVETLMQNYLDVYNAAREDFIIGEFMLVPMNDHAHSSPYVWDNRLPDSLHPAAVYAPMVMAILILLVACFNFTNTAIASSNGRLKEIGIRKVLGSDRRQLMVQFMGENMIACILAILLSIGIAYFLVPAYSAMWPDLEIELDFIENPGIFVFLIGMLVFTTFLAGFYPSLYVSRYEPVSILRGKLKIGGTSWLSKSLLGLQYAFTIMALFASVAFIQNARYQETLDMGFNTDQIIGVRVMNERQYQEMYNAMSSNPDFESFSGSGHHINYWTYGSNLTNQEQEIRASMMDIGLDYMKTMDIQVIEGRGFVKEFEASDPSKSILVNKKMVEEFGWKEALGQRLYLNDTTFLTVVGVVDNFYTYGVWAEIPPLGLRLRTNDYNLVIGKVNISNVVQSYEYLEQTWNEKIPTKTFNGFYQDELLQEAKTANTNIVQIFTFLGVLALVLSCIGLFTLVSLNIIRRTKEIGVRKVLGGTVTHIIGLINSPFLILLTIASALGLVGGYYLIDMLIATIFTYYQDMNFVTFFVPAIVILGLSFVISSLRTLQTALVNPVESLRYE